MTLSKSNSWQQQKLIISSILKVFCFLCTVLTDCSAVCSLVYRCCSSVLGQNSGGTWAAHEEDWGVCRWWLLKQCRKHLHALPARYCTQRSYISICLSLSFPYLPLGLSRQSCVNHDMGGDKPKLEIHLTEFPHRCCTCFPGMASVSVYGVKILSLPV